MNKVIFFSAFFFLATVAMASNDNNGRNGEPTPAKLTFQDFLQQFPMGSLPYTFSETELQHQLDVRTSNNGNAEKPQRLAWEYYEFLPDLEEIASHSSMPVYPEPVVAFETDNSYAVVYNTGRAFAKQFKTYNVALFDKNGNHQATYCIAGVQPTVLTAATLDEQLHVTIKEYQVKWEKDPAAAGIKGNNVSELNLIFTKKVNLTGPDRAMLSPFEMPTELQGSAIAETK